MNQSAVNGGISLLHCALCSREFPHRDVRTSPNGPLCHSCWTVICPQPWPKDDSAHGGMLSNTHGGVRPDGIAAAKAAAAHEAAEAAQAAHRMSMQRRSYSMANIAGVAVPGARPAHHNRLPNSMPEHQAILSGSADDPRWTALASAPQIAGSAPSWRNSSLGAASELPPTFSPVELRNMMQEESLELFESQSHLLDPQSRVVLQRQRQYLQWQSSLEEPGPMQSVLERQESAGSGCNELIEGGTAAAAAAGGIVSDIDTNNGVVGGSSQQLLHELQGIKRHLAIVSREREHLATRVTQLEAELQAQRESTLCKICRQTQRNCVILPCLHFTTCDNCFKRHAASTLSCPMCNGRVTGFQTLLML